MGFLLRSAFWLGVVYSAMPLDVASLAPATTRASAAVSALCPPPAGAPSSCLGAPLAACGVAEDALCARLREAVAGEAAASAAERTPAPVKRRPPSSDTLTPSDRAAPWRGPPLRSQG